MELKVVLNTKDGKSYSRTVDGSRLIGMKIGQDFKGELINMPGYEFRITGGSDFAGFPMRKDVNTQRARILAVKGTGIKKSEKGKRVRKTVAGKIVHEKIAQLNLLVLKEGAEPLAKKEEKKE